MWATGLGGTVTTTSASLEGVLSFTPPATASGSAVLAIQTEPETQSVLQHGLSCLGLMVDTAPDGARGVIGALSGKYELILLDLVLPAGDGFDVLANLRAARPDLPVIVLTALGGVENRVHALEVGAVDYVVKPYSLRELAARIRAQLRQSASSRSTRLSGGGVDIDPLTHAVSQGGAPIHLTTLEFRLLVFLMERPGFTHSRRDIMRGVWGHEVEPAMNLVDVYVGYLRRKLRVNGSAHESPIQTVRSRGYRFVDTSAG